MVSHIKNQKGLNVLLCFHGWRTSFRHQKHCFKLDRKYSWRQLFFTVLSAVFVFWTSYLLLILKCCWHLAVTFTHVDRNTASFRQYVPTRYEMQYIIISLQRWVECWASSAFYNWKELCQPSLLVMSASIHFVWIVCLGCGYFLRSYRCHASWR